MAGPEADGERSRLRLRTLFVVRDGVIRPVWRIVLFLLVSATAASVIGSLVTVVARFDEPADPIGVLTFPLALLIGQWIMLRWVDRRTWSAIGLGRAQASPVFIARGFALGALAIGLPCAVLLSFRWLDTQPAIFPSLSWPWFMLSITWFLAWAALWEELLVRGYAFAVLRERLGPLAALSVTSVIFAILHLQNPEASAQSVGIVVLAGVFLGSVVLVTGSVYAAWAAHLGWNWVLVALLHAPVSGFAMPVPGYRVVDAGPDWATGGAWGPEGGVFAALGLMSGIAYLVSRRSRRRES